MHSLVDVLLEARRRIAGDEWLEAELDGYVEQARAGTFPGGATILFLPTGPLQEASLDDGWGDEFCALADRFDRAAAAHAGHAAHYCSRCGKKAGELRCLDGTLLRESFTSVLTQAETPAVRAAIGDAAALHALDPELAPFYCPACGRTYCGEHWRRHDVFDGDFHEGIRGTCPEGHERLLED